MVGFYLWAKILQLRTYYLIKSAAAELHASTLDIQSWQAFSHSWLPPCLRHVIKMVIALISTLWWRLLADMCRGQKSGSKIRRIRLQNRMPRSKIYRIPWQNYLVRIQDLQDLTTKKCDPGLPGSHCNNTNSRSRISRILRWKNIRYKIHRVQHPRDLKTEQT